MGLRMTQLPLFILATLTLQLCLALPAVDFMDLDDEILPEEKAGNIQYRLPEDFDAVDYQLSITPYFEGNGDKSFTFDGAVVMLLKPKKANLLQITLHAKELVVKREDILINAVGDTTNVAVSNIEPIDLYDFLKINLVDALDQAKTYVISIKYTGLIGKEMSGFYRSSYKENGVTKWLGTTQFQTTSARKAFPCLDEPQYKATFTVTIIRPKTFSKSLSNMPIESTVDTSVTTVKETFYKTPIMSTYLLAFIVSEFQAASETSNDLKYFGVWARPGAKTMGKYAFDTGRELLSSMDDFTGVKYYEMNANMKMDQAGIPDFSAGAMENWGLLTYREAYLMYDPVESSVKYRQQVNAILAHEITHMWFGDLVTCHWWSDTWLNEGFARYFQYLLPDLVEDLDMKTQFIPAQLQTALLADTSVHSAPLTNEDVNTPAQISGHFGTISYNKGASVIKMIEHWIGTPTFKKALNNYLTTKRFQSSKPEDLFKAFQDQADSDKSLTAYPAKTVAAVMSSWTSQSGYPLLQVDIDYGKATMNITQSRMIALGEEPLPDVLYQIPITFATKSNADFDNTKPVVVMGTKNLQVSKGGEGMEWVVLNKKQTGYYRVNYDDHSWGMLRSTLTGASRTEIHTLNRAQIVDDVLNLARENLMDYGLALNVTEFLAVERDYAPWTAAYAGFNFLRRRLAYVPDTLPKLDHHILTLMENVTESLGFSENETDSHLTKLFRASTLNLACQLGHEGCTNSSVELFENLMTKGIKVNANLREHVYCNGLRYGNGTHFDYLWAKYLSDNVVNEQITILGALGCTKNEASIIKLLKQTITPDSPIRDQDLMTAYNSILNGNDENVEVVFQFIRTNLAEIKTFYGGNTQTALVNLIGRMRGTQLQRVLAFLRSSDELSASHVNAGISAIANAGVGYEWAMLHKSTLDTWLDLKYKGGASAIASSFALLFTAMMALLLNRH